jgi:hypothetical protein
MSEARRTQVARRIRALLAERRLSVYEVLHEFPNDDYRAILQAWGDVRTEVALVPDAHGRYGPPPPPAP